jgi:asparagine synthase (glutamine-hydrolysing)
VCGIAGVLDPKAATAGDELAARAGAMAATLGHRGPDDSGTWVDAHDGVAFSHRRLSVVGLGPVGHQPMVSPGGRYVLNYNGEIYNFAALARGLESAGAAVEAASDAQVLLGAIETWGMEEAIDRCEGMFAFALWDRHRHQLHLVRDRFGEKPLYYGWVQEHFAFASELKALRALPGFEAELDRAAVALFLRHNCIPAPRTIYRSMAKLEPGQLVTIGRGWGRGQTPAGRTYWSARQAVEAARARPLSEGPEELADRVEQTLGDAVSARMVADVPVGAFLSGGVDSTLVVALMQRAASLPVRTFTVGFAEAAFDESAHATAVAAHLGTVHSVLEVGDAEARAVIPRLADIWDEPFGDSSQIPTLLVSRLARSEVTVSLSGDAGDELFAGYNRHAWLERLSRRFAVVPAPLRRGLGAGMGKVPPGVVDLAAAALPARWQVRNPSDKFEKLGRVLGARGAQEAYLALVSHWQAPEAMVRGAPAGVSPDARSLAARPSSWPALGGITEQMLWLDLVGYLPDDILTKLDRAAMAVSLETRVPYLDRAVLDLAWRLPLEAKVDGGVTKRVLRTVLHRLVPPALVERPKMGFGVPVAAWLRGPLRSWASELLDPDRLAGQELLDPRPVRRAWQSHLSGRGDHAYALWDVLMLQSWLERWMAKGTAPVPSRPVGTGGGSR